MKHKKAMLALVMSLTMMMGTLPSFAVDSEPVHDNQQSPEQGKQMIAEISESTNQVTQDSEVNSETKNAVKTEGQIDKQTGSEDTTNGDGKLSITSGNNGNVTLSKDGKVVLLVASGKTENISVAVGDEVSIKAYGNQQNLTINGAEKTSEKEIQGEEGIEYLLKVTSKDASIKIGFGQEKTFASSARRAASRIVMRAMVTSGTITRIGDLNGSGIGKFWVTAAGGDLYGVCCNRENHAVGAGGEGVTLSAVSRTSPLGRIAYYGATHPSEVDQYITSAAASYVRNGNSGTYNQYAAYHRIADQANAGTLPAGPEGFEVYTGTPGSKQVMLIWRYVPVNGYLKLVKSVASNKEIVEECKMMYSLAGAEYGVYSDAGLQNRVGTLKTGEGGSSNTLQLRKGTYYVKEVKAPAGYGLDQQTYTVTVAVDQTTTVDSEDEPQFDPVSVVLKKIATDGSYLNDGDMSNAEFTIRYYDSISDDVSNLTPTRTWKLKTLKDKAGTYGAQLRSKYVVDGSDEFYKNEQGIIVIPRGTITIQETKAPKGYKVDPKMYIYKVDQDSEDQSIHLNFGNTPEQPNKPLVPQIGTSAADVSTKDNVGSYGKTVTIKDKVQYKELSEGETYTIKGTLMDTETGLPLMVNGNAVSSEKTFTVTKDNSTITGDGASGTVELEYTLDSTVLAGKTTTVFEYLYYDGKQIATHADISDEGQTVHFPEIKTTAKSEDTDAHQGMPGKTETIVDTVHYTNLVPGKSYTVKGKLMDKGSGKAILDDGGKEITAEKTFTPDQAEGDVELEFTYDSSLRQGKSTVVFEDLYHENVEVATHSDISDRDQTIDYPDIHTSADLKQTGRITGGTTTIIDRVTYTNLAKGKTYTIKGKLMDRKTGQPLVSDGKEITAERTFTATDINGTVVMEFTAPVKLIAGKSTVVFEDMYHEDVKIATHSDLTDKNQTVSIGELTVSGNGEGGFPITGDSSKILYAVAALAFAVVALGGIVHMHKLNKRRK